MNSITIARLKELEKTADDFWNVSHQTGNFISMLIKATNTKNVLEIGTSNGYSGLWIADALKTTGGHLTTLEFWEKRQCLAREYFAESGLSEIEIVFGAITLTLPAEFVKQFILQLEAYAYKCYVNTAKHQQKIQSLQTLEDILNYDYTTGYPEKIILE